MSDSCHITLANARAFANRASLMELQQWKPCGMEGCVFCDEVVARIRDRLTVDHTQQTTTDGRDASVVREEQMQARGSGQHKSYIILTEQERAKGFVRPVRRSYKHVGPSEPHGLRDLTPEEHERYDKYGYLKFQPYPQELQRGTGRFWTQAMLDRIGKGCGAVTTMGTAIAETYARDPSFYGSTFCTTCGDHYPVGIAGEFVWLDDPDERVGT